LALAVENVAALGLLSMVVSFAAGAQSPDFLVLVWLAYVPLLSGRPTAAAGPAAVLGIQAARAALLPQPARTVVAAGAALVGVASAASLPRFAQPSLSACVSAAARAATAWLVVINVNELFQGPVPAASSSPKAVPLVGFYTAGVAPAVALHIAPFWRGDGVPRSLFVDLPLPSASPQQAVEVTLSPDDGLLSSTEPSSIDWSIACGYPVTLPNDTILWVGGREPWKAMDLASGTIFITRFDPRAGRFSKAATMPNKRYYASAILLPGGAKVLVAGDGPSADIFSAADVPEHVGSFSLPQPLLSSANPLYYPGMFALPTGDLLVFSCRAGMVMTVAGAVVATAPSLDGTAYAHCTQLCAPPAFWAAKSSATLVYFGGCILGGGRGPQAATQSIRLVVHWAAGQYTFDPWDVEEMPGPRSVASAVMLPNGAVVVVNGGRNGEAGFHTQRNPVFEAWLYNTSAPSGSRYAVLATTAIPRFYHSSAVLAVPRGDILVAGCGSCVAEDVASPESYRTSLAGDRNEYRAEVLETGFYEPCLVLGPVSLAFGASFSATTTCPRPSNLRAVLMQPGSDSHCTNLAQRVVPLSGTCNASGTCAFSAPDSDAVLPSGLHWLFGVRPDGHHSGGFPVRLT
jgi:hypothetical protein